MTKHEFFVNDQGDPSVGIWPAHSKVTIETELDFKGEEAMIKAWIADLFDCHAKHILTAEEAEAEEKAIKEYEIFIDEAEERFRQQIDAHGKD